MDQFYRSLMEVFLPPPYPPQVKLIEDQLKVILLEILSEGVQWNSIFIHWLLSMLTKLPKIGGKQGKFGKYLSKNTVFLSER